MTIEELERARDEAELKLNVAMLSAESTELLWREAKANLDRCSTEFIKANRDYLLEKLKGGSPADE